MKNENSQVREIPIGLIDDPKSPIRSGADESRLHELADSIRDVGLIQPILVRPVGNRFEVIAGHRRLVACKFINKPIVRCIVGNINDAGCDVIKLHENLCREDVNPVDQARWIARVAKEKNLSVSDLAKMLRRGEGYIKERLDLLNWDPVVIAAVGSGKISFSAARWFAKITDQPIRRHYLEVGIRQGVSAMLAYDWFKSWQSKGLPAPPPPPTKVPFEEREKVQYYNERCHICGQPIAMGEEKILFVHPECYEEVSRDIEEKSD